MSVWGTSQTTAAWTEFPVSPPWPPQQGALVTPRQRRALCPGKASWPRPVP